MSDLLLRKRKTLFKLIDIDHDGFLTKQDYDGIADRFIKKGNLGGEAAQDVRDKLHQVGQWSRITDAYIN